MEVFVTEAERVATIADVMRAKGLRKVRVGDLEIELGDKPRETVPIPPGASVTPTPGPDESFMLPAEGLCRCGHPMVDHAAHGCLVGGCPIETCMNAKV